MGMIPGLSKLQLKQQIDQEDVEKRLKKVEAIINSMTAQERKRPKLINASRKKRIARGSGLDVRDVNEVLNQFRQMQAMMGEFRKGRFPNIPGMPGMFGN
jgi:signal recognition particle subunit SRP54